jgi:tetratricopeptide (TPR) repeat protein
MKCMDCVSVCPENALYFGFGKPAVGKRRKRDRGSIGAGDVVVFLAVLGFATWWITLWDEPVPIPKWFAALTGAALAFAFVRASRGNREFDFTRGEELAMAAIFLLSSQLAFRRLYGVVPHLLAIGLGALTALAAILVWRLVRGRDLRVQHHVVREAGRLTRKGKLIAAGCVAWFAFGAHSALIHHETDAAQELVNAASRLPHAERGELLAASRARIAFVDRWGLADNHNIRFLDGQIAFSLGRFDHAARHLERAVELNPQDRGAWFTLADTYFFWRKPEQAAAVLGRLLEHNPGDAEARSRLDSLRSGSTGR